MNEVFRKLESMLIRLIIVKNLKNFFKVILNRTVVKTKRYSRITVKFGKIDLRSAFINKLTVKTMELILMFLIVLIRVKQKIMIQ